jgi:hypothetical protein
MTTIGPPILNGVILYSAPFLFHFFYFTHGNVDEAGGADLKHGLVTFNYKGKHITPNLSLKNIRI